MIRIFRTGMFALLLLLPVTALAAPAQYQLKVDGLACPFCAYGIEKELAALDGVDSVETHIGDGVVIVTVQDGVSLDEATAKTAVEAAGFSLNGFHEIQAGGER